MEKVTTPTHSNSDSTRVAEGVARAADKISSEIRSESGCWPSDTDCWDVAVCTCAGGSKKKGDIAKIMLSQEEYDFRIEVSSGG